MTRLRTISMLAFCALALRPALLAQQQPVWEIEALSDESGVVYDFQTGLTTATNGVIVKYGSAVLTADRASVNQPLGEVVADGRVRIQQEEQVWAGEHMTYNFETHQIEAEQFRTGEPPIFAAGRNLHGEVTNQVYFATNALLTTDNVSSPAIKIRARYIKIIPGDKIEAYHATLWIGGVPVFYFPYYSRSLVESGNNFNFTPGYRNSWGPFLLSSYTWILNQELDAKMHVDYRERHGIGFGPDINYHLGAWGEGSFRYYYLHDQDPNAGNTGNGMIPENRQRIFFSYLANPVTNLQVRAMVRYQGDTNIIRDFFEGEYRQNPQPNSYIEVNKFWQNFSLDALAQPQVNDFLETVERLPEVRLTGFRQQLGDSPVYYESQSSIGYYRRLFPETNSGPSSLNYSASRADTYQQLLLPETFFSWLNVIPRVGGRFTYYSEANGGGAMTDEQARGVFDTGAEVSFKASRVWPEVQSDFFQMDGLRHIIEPSINYVYAPQPNVLPNQVPQFDYIMPSLRLLPIDFPDFNGIDSINSENVFRFGLHNKLQTKRQGEVVNLVDWNVYTDWLLKPLTNQTTFSDIYSDLVIRPRSWLTIESLTRYDVEDGLWRMSLTTLTLKPNDHFSWTLGQYYLRTDTSTSPTSLGPGNNLFTSTLYCYLNENWGLRAYQRFEAQDGVMQEQAYSIYRDMRSWTAALTFRVLNNPGSRQDYTIAFTFSLKAFPHFKQGADRTDPSLLWGEI